MLVDQAQPPLPLDEQEEERVEVPGSPTQALLGVQVRRHRKEVNRFDSSKAGPQPLVSKQLSPRQRTTGQSDAKFGRRPQLDKNREENELSDSDMSIEDLEDEAAELD